MDDRPEPVRPVVAATCEQPDPITVAADDHSIAVVLNCDTSRRGAHDLSATADLARRHQLYALRLHCSAVFIGALHPGELLHLLLYCERRHPEDAYERGRCQNTCLLVFLYMQIALVLIYMACLVNAGVFF